MCRWYTNSVNKAARMAALIALAVVVCLGQTTSGPQPDASWHRVGTTTVAEGLAGPATGAVTNVWYRGGSLLARTASGRVFESADLSHWRLNTAGIPPAFDSMASDARAIRDAAERRSLISAEGCVTLCGTLVHLVNP